MLIKVPTHRKLSYFHLIEQDVPKRFSLRKLSASKYVPYRKAAIMLNMSAEDFLLYLSDHRTMYGFRAPPPHHDLILVHPDVLTKLAAGKLKRFITQMTSPKTLSILLGEPLPRK